MESTLVFIHGLESTSQGNKAQYFRKYYPQMIIHDYRGDFPARMQKLGNVLQNKNDLILVGSSYGGLMAASYALDNEQSIKKLVLLAPALNIEGFEKAVKQKLKIPVIIYHGTNDEVVEPSNVYRIAKNSFEKLEYHLVEDDHPLTKVFPSLPWPELLEQKG
ncbi:MAG TPA: alpha/beta fold hydrolase [Smithellaceae bacterium]|nr:alpha/beta fold hydrolase [Smithellaceae bacterium]HQF85340.1 alpha/beta fold hydrolase [Smithellaceae bacterium]HQG81562.1 alpha/beta fold hydrolase [Smithellaceae bacterium]